MVDRSSVTSGTLTDTLFEVLARVDGSGGTIVLASLLFYVMW